MHRGGRSWSEAGATKTRGADNPLNVKKVPRPKKKSVEDGGGADGDGDVGINVGVEFVDAERVLELLSDFGYAR